MSDAPDHSDGNDPLPVNPAMTPPEKMTVAEAKANFRRKAEAVTLRSLVAQNPTGAVLAAFTAGFAAGTPVEKLSFVGEITGIAGKLLSSCGNYVQK